MKILNERYYKMSNASFCYGLESVQHTVYSYLVCCAGSKGRCWPSMKTIAASCRCAVNTARKAIDQLERRGFIRKMPTYSRDRQGRGRQTNNTYFILELPDLPSAPPQEVYYATPPDGGELYQQNEGNKLKGVPTPMASAVGERRNTSVG